MSPGANAVLDNENEPFLHHNSSWILLHFVESSLNPGSWKLDRLSRGTDLLCFHARNSIATVWQKDMIRNPKRYVWGLMVD